MRISHKALEQLLTLTNSEMNIYLYLAKRQNLAGFVVGVHHQDVCLSCAVSKQTFYNALVGLQEKNVIQCTSSNYHDYDIKLLNNDFSKPNGFKQGYISLKKLFTLLPVFQQMKAKEKYLLLEFLKVTFKQGRMYRINLQGFYDKFCRSLQISIRTLRGYLHTLKEFFTIKREKKNYIILPTDTLFIQSEENVEEMEHTQYVNAQIRRNVSLKNCKEEEVKDIVDLIKQYRYEATAQKKDIFSIIRLSIEYACDRIVSAKYIHKLVRASLDLEQI